MSERQSDINSHEALIKLIPAWGPCSGGCSVCLNLRFESTSGMTVLFLSLEGPSSFWGTWQSAEVCAEKGILDSSGTWVLLILFKPGLSSLSSVVPPVQQVALLGPSCALGGAQRHPWAQALESAAPPHWGNKKCLQALPKVPWGQSRPPSLSIDTGLQ